MKQTSHPPLKLLVTSYDYRPRLGGVATCSYELACALARIPGVKIRMLAKQHPDHDSFDRGSQFETVRLNLGDNTLSATLRLSWALLKQRLSWRPDALLCFLWLPESAAAFIAGPYPYFTVVHGVEIVETDRNFKKKLRKAFAPIKRWILRRARVVFPVSHFTGQLLVDECGVPPARIHVIRNGVNLSKFFPAPLDEPLLAKHGLQGKRYFFTVSRLHDYKGMDRAIASFSRAAPAFPDAVYAIAGEGPDRARLEAIARHYRVADRIRFLGPVAFDELNSLYNGAECFVLLTREDRETPNFEGFGLVFLEAGACAKPSIGGASGGIPDAIVDGHTGWLVDPTDDAAISQAMIECLQHPQQTRLFGANALERIRKELTWDKIAANVHQEILKNVRN